MIAVNKADGDREQEARGRPPASSPARCRLVPTAAGEWAPPVRDLLGPRGRRRRRRLGSRCWRTASTSGADGLARKRAGQQLDFTWALVRDELAQRLRRSPGVAAIRDEVRAAVLAGRAAAPVAADRLLAAYDDPAGRAEPVDPETPGRDVAGSN